MKLDLRIDEVLPQPIQAVWNALTNSRLLARWLMDNDFEPRVGHRFTLTDPPTNDWRGFIECEVLEMDPPHRMVWSWNGGSTGESSSRIVFELAAEGASTRLVLRHLGDEATETESATLRSGWTRKLARVSGALGADYGRRIAFRASRLNVFEAIATNEGLRGWWTPLVTGAASIGGELRFDFAGASEHIMMRVDESQRPSSVRWTCLVHSRLSDWANTKVHFELLERAREGCELYFRHEGLRAELECYGMCSVGWDRFLRSLVLYVETGRGAPFTQRTAPPPTG